MNFTYRILFLFLLAISGYIEARPFVPEKGNQVLERLPERFFQSEVSAKIKKLKAQYKNNPKDWSSASELAQHYIELSERQADPRYLGYAQAVLDPWWKQPQPPVTAIIMRAVIRQKSHEFTSASEDLDQVLNIQPGHIQANYIKATIATVQGDYQKAIHHCRQLMRRSSMVQSLVCQSTATSLNGNAKASYRLLLQLLSAEELMSEKEKNWAWTSLAEIAWRLGNFEAAEQHFQTAMKGTEKDVYLLRVYADFLLHQQRPFKVIELLASETRIDSLLLRLALAEKMTQSEQLNHHIKVLSERFKANRKRGSALHQADEARFMLYLMNKPAVALQLARQNWQVQRESSDAYILLQAAIAAKDSKTIQQLVDWLNKQGTEDVLIDQILATQEGQRHEI